jgi:dihydrofolate reductase
MRTIRIAEHISMDGVIAPGGRNTDADWTSQYRSAAGAEALAERYGKGFDLLLGRRTYDQWSSFWPNMKGGPFAEGLNAATKYVATHRPESLEWGPIGDLGPDAIEGIRRLKAQDGSVLMVCGSSTITSVLLEQGLVDEVVLCVYPILLGPGKRLFSDTADPRELSLVSSKATPTGVLVNTYHHVGSAQLKAPAART